jgi:heat shock protein HslJ
MTQQHQQRSPLVTVAIIAAVAIGAVAVFALLGRGPDNGALTGKTWQLTAITGQTPSFQGVFPPEEQVLYTVEFATDGSLAARADCNAVTGTYELSGDDGMTITLGSSTLVACPDGSYGTIFANELGNVTTWAIASSELTLTTADGGAGTFVEGSGTVIVPSPSASPSESASPSASASPTPSATPSPTPSATPSPAPSATATAAPSEGPSEAPTASPSPTPTPTASPTPAPTPAPTPGADLVGTSWQLANINTRDPVHQGVIPVEERSKYTLSFAEGGLFTAIADCNTIGGNWTATADGGLALTIVPSTIVECGDGSHGDLYVLALSNTASYVVATDTLTITLDDGGTLGYEPIPAPT